MAENIALNHATASYSGSATNIGTSPADTNDDNTNTKYGMYETPYAAGDYYRSGAFTYTLDDTYYISDLEIVGNFGVSGGDFAGTRRFSIEYIDALTLDWVVLYTGGTLGSATRYSINPGTMAVPFGKMTNTVRISYTYHATIQYVNALSLAAIINELRLFSDRADSGLRIKTPQGTVSLAEDTGGVSPLKVRDGSITRSLLLVPPSDAAASPLRIRHNGVTYAVAKL